MLTGLAIIVFTAVALVFVGVLLFVSWAVRPPSPRGRETSTYECGFPAEGDSRSIGFGYLNYAVLFLVFDIAAIYLFLYARLQRPPAVAVVSFTLGLLTLLVLIIYATRKGRYYVA